MIVNRRLKVSATIYYIKNESGMIIHQTMIESERNSIYDQMITEGKKVSKDSKSYITGTYYPSNGYIKG
jgi:hypothetical protein